MNPAQQTPSPASFAQCSSGISTDLLESILPAALVVQWCAETGDVWRTSKLPPPAFLYSALWRALNPDKSIRNVTEQLAAQKIVITPSAWMQARTRRGLDLLHRALCETYRQSTRMTEAQRCFHGHPVFLADGSTLSLPDTPDLAKAFGYSQTGRGQSQFPVARFVALVAGGLQTVLDYRLDAYRRSEIALFRELLPSLPAGSLLLADCLLSTFHLHTQLVRRGVHFLMPLHQSRDPWKLVQAPDTVQLGPNDWLVTLRINRTQRGKYADLDLPESLPVRLIYRGDRTGAWVPPTDNSARSPRSWLLTSLLDAQRYPVAEIAALFPGRWDIETDLGHLKTTLEGAVLRSRQEPHVRKEVAALLTAYNLVWIVIHQAARRANRAAQSLSFSGAIKTLTSYRLRVFHTSSLDERQQLTDEILDRVARHIVLRRPGRIEPRKVKRTYNRYPPLTRSRQEERLLCAP
jgi:hypothetical protein